MSQQAGSAEKLRVLHVMASGAHGGGADHLLGLLPAQAQRGIVVRAAVGDNGPLAHKLTRAGIACLRLQLMQPGRPRQHLLQHAACLAATVDVVHWHGSRAAFFGSLAAFWAARRRAMVAAPQAAPRLVYTAHGLAFRQNVSRRKRCLMAAAEALICRNADAVISVSSTDLAALRQAGCLWRRLAAHVPNAVDGQRFKPKSQDQVRRALGLCHGPMWVGTVSRLVPQKNVKALMQALLPLPNVHLVVVGDGPQRAALAQHPLALAKRVRFLGSRDDVADILPAFDVFALASQWEGEPIALLEAMLCAVPCVATDTPGAVEVLQPPRLGLCVPRACSASLTEAVRLLLSDIDLRRRLGSAGRVAARARTYAAQAEQVIAVYQALRLAA